MSETTTDETAAGREERGPGEPEPRPTTAGGGGGGAPAAGGTERGEERGTERPRASDGGGDGGSGSGSGSGSEANRNRRRRGSRGGRGRGRGGSGGQSGLGGTSSPEGGAAVAGPAPSGVPTAPRPVPSAGERPKIGDTRPAPPVPAAQPRAARGGRDRGQVNRARDRNTGRQGGSEGTSREPLVTAPEMRAADGEAGRSRRSRRQGGRQRGGKAVGRYSICVHVQPHMTQIAVLEGRTLVEHYVSRAADDTTQIDGNIYVGRVQNVLPGMEAAFIDIGTPKNAVLYRGDVRYDTEDVERSSGSPRIEDVLRPGQLILCQVTKNPIGAKGARLTQEVSLPGRFVVLVPDNAAYGISKRLDDSERKRLRKIIDSVKPEGHGMIVRTAAAGASAEELRADVERLVSLWNEISGAAAKVNVPTLLYREPDSALRIIREELTAEYRSVVVDDPAVFEQVRDYVASVNPELADRVELYDTAEQPLPIFERYHVHEQLHKALERKVYLPSGGSLVIDRTEALTVIDVNTGKNVGSTNLEETVFRNNLEAAEEVARQLRLRDIGGIIVIDFIDMEVKDNRAKVSSALRAALSRDKTRMQVFDISELGLVEMTRKRVSEGLIESLSDVCSLCGGRGVIIDETAL